MSWVLHPDYHRCQSALMPHPPQQTHRQIDALLTFGARAGYHTCYCNRPGHTYARSLLVGSVIALAGVLEQFLCVSQITRILFVIEVVGFVPLLLMLAVDFFTAITSLLVHGAVLCMLVNPSVCRVCFDLFLSLSSYCLLLCCLFLFFFFFFFFVVVVVVIALMCSAQSRGG